MTAIINPQIAMSFETHRDILDRRIRETPAIFKKDDYKSFDRQELRKWNLDHFKEIGSSYEWNTSDVRLPIFPAVHGTEASIAWKIANNGFSALSSLDAGFYGVGMYFSSSALYTLPYFASKKNPAILLVCLNPGNPFPVVEDRKEKDSFYGKPIRPGYQSNYVLTERDGSPCQKEKGTIFYVNIVIFYYIIISLSEY